MRVAFYSPDTGIFSGQVFDGPDFAVDANTPAGLVAWVCDGADPAPERQRVEAGELVDYDPPAAAFPECLRDRLREVVTTAGRCYFAPIAYAGAVWDADETARGRIAGVLSRLARGVGLPAGWLGWRDFDNGMHWADSGPAAVAQHLAELSAAIEDREQAVLVAAWRHKEALREIGRAGTVAELMAYDLAAGWPG